MGMYFSSISAATVIFLLAGCLNVANMVYYSSSEYDPDREERNKFDLNLLAMLQFSTICLTREWVVCAGCSENIGYWDTIFTNMYFATGTDENGDEVTLIRYSGKRGG